MKTVLLLFTIFGLAYTAKSQTVNGLSLSQIPVEYVELMVHAKALSTRCNALVDYGQAYGLSYNPKEKTITDANGKFIEFYSSIGALDLMLKNGYELVTAFTPASGNQTDRVYLLRNKNYKVKDGSH